MNPKVSFWATMTGLAAIVSTMVAIPAHATSAPIESVTQRIAKVREAMSQQQIRQNADAQNPNADSILISQWDNVTGSGWTNTPTWVNWNNGSSYPSWGNGWTNWDNT